MLVIMTYLELCANDFHLLLIVISSASILALPFNFLVYCFNILVPAYLGCAGNWPINTRTNLTFNSDECIFIEAGDCSGTCIQV